MRIEGVLDLSGFSAKDVNSLTADITRFNALPAGALQFFRYEIEFDLGLGTPGTGHQPDALSLEFLEIPFVF